MDTSKEFTGEKNQKVNKSNCWGEKVMSNSMLQTGNAAHMCQSPNFVGDYDLSPIQTKTEAQATVSTDKNGSRRFRDYIDLECDIENDTTYMGQSPIFVADYDFSPMQTKTEAQATVSTDIKGSRRFREYINLECDIENDSRCLLAPFLVPPPDGDNVRIIKETPGICASNLIASIESLSKNEFVTSTESYPFTELPNQLLSNQPLLSKSMCLLASPERNASTSTNGLIPETESASSLSINSHIQKRRKSLGWSLYNHLQVESKFGKSNVHQMLIRENCSSSTAASDLVIDKGLQIFCSLCRKPLGLPENDLYVTCSITSSSKVHLASLWKEMLPPLVVNGSSSLPVMICDVSAIHQQLFQITIEGASGQGVWCKEDRCVFSTIFCSFCSNPNSCLGVQVMATDASNVHLLNKMLFYLDRK